MHGCVSAGDQGSEGCVSVVAVAGETACAYGVGMYVSA